MYYQLPKSDKKIARACLDKGLKQNFMKGWRNLKPSSGTGGTENLPVIKKPIIGCTGPWIKNIARRYDGLGGSRCLITVAAILQDGYISEDDIKEFSDETRSKIRLLNRE